MLTAAQNFSSNLDLRLLPIIFKHFNLMGGLLFSFLGGKKMCF